MSKTLGMISTRIGNRQVTDSEIPASGTRSESCLVDHGLKGHYWSSALDYSDVSFAYYLDFGKNGYGSNYSVYCYHGYTVRSVAEP